MSTGTQQTVNRVIARAAYLGQRINIKQFHQDQYLAQNPLVIDYGVAGKAVIQRYGVVVSFGLDSFEQARMVDEVMRYVESPNDEVLQDSITIETGYAQSAIVLSTIQILELSVPVLQAIADILAKTVVLDYYEKFIASAFDRIEPLSQTLKQRGRGGEKDKELLSQIGEILLIESKMVGRVEISEKPEVLWEYPELEKFYQRLNDEYEIKERHLALERKLKLITRMAETLLDLLQHKRSLRVEWYIVILIVIDIIVSVAEKVFW